MQLSQAILGVQVIEGPQPALCPYLVLGSG